MTDPALNELFRHPLSDRACGFLREVKFAGNSLQIAGPDALQRALQCRAAGYLHITLDDQTAKLTGLGQAYLDRMMRAH